MDKKIKHLGIALMSSMTLLLAPTAISAESPEVKEAAKADDFELTIFHTNDIHANINNFGKLSYFLNEQRSKLDHSMYFDAGDAFSGNPVVDLVDGIPIIELFNQMEVDLFTVGNHEFDYGQEAFRDRRNESNFTWLSANMDASGSSILDEAEAYEIFEFPEEDIKVGVIGLTQAPPATAPAGLKGLHFEPYYETVQKYAHLRDEVDILIALNHIGLAADKHLAEQTDMFDLIIGGHSHTALSEPVVVNGTPIAQSGSQAKNMGVLDLSFNRENSELTVNGRLHSIEEMDDSQTDPAVQKMVDQYNAETEGLLSQKLGVTKNELNRDARWTKDVSIGNLITDALRNFTNTDIAITNNGGIRAGIEAGDITARDIFTVDPFGNVVTIVEMKGHDLKEVLKYSFHRSEEDYGRQIDLQTSGLTYKFITEEPAEGEQFGKYVDVELFIDGEPMDLDKNYTITTNNFIIEGGDGYDFSKAKMVQEDQGKVTAALIQYIQTEKTVDYPATEDRITVQVGRTPIIEETGWVKKDNNWFYYDTNGEAQTAWNKVNDTWYYMNDQGVMQTGWIQLDENWYYLNASGAMQTGWTQTKTGGKWYYMNPSGVMQTGWKKLHGSWYYMNARGAMQTGWTQTKTGGKWYYMHSNGRMQTGWNKINSKWYYLDGTGAWQK